MKILIVEDHVETGQLVQRALGEQGVQARLAPDAAHAKASIAEETFDAIVLDWGLPDQSGPELCGEIRAAGNPTPILMLTARGEVSDRVDGLNAGADDYLRKPFAVAELLARLRALARRGPHVKPDRFSIGEVEVSVGERRVWVHGAEVPFTLREFSVLEFLLTRAGNAVSTSELLGAVWGEESAAARASLDVILSRMRRKLTFEKLQPIQTIRGYGYLLKAPA